MQATAPIPAWIDGTLVAMDKLDVHRRGLRHPAVSVFVLSGRSVLLQKRAAGKYHTPGLWANSCCTHPHWGEAAQDCARRRLREELGIDGLALHWAGQVEYRAEVGRGLTEHELVEVFTAEAPARLLATPDPAEVAEVRWCDLDTLQAEIDAAPQHFVPWLRIYLAEHRARLFGPAAALPGASG